MPGPKSDQPDLAQKKKAQGWDLDDTPEDRGRRTDPRSPDPMRRIGADLAKRYSWKSSAPKCRDFSWLRCFKGKQKQLPRSKRTQITGTSLEQTRTNNNKHCTLLGSWAPSLRRDHAAPFQIYRVSSVGCPRYLTSACFDTRAKSRSTTMAQQKLHQFTPHPWRRCGGQFYWAPSRHR